MGEFSAIDPTAMQGMIKSYTRDKDDLRNSAGTLKSRFDRFGIDTGDLTQILGICTWLDDQLSTLTRHQALGAALEREHPGLNMVQVPEPVISAAEARKEGKELADEFSKNTSGDEKAGKEYHDLALKLAAHKDDPDYCSSFYANLNPPIQAETLPSLLASTGSSTAGEDLKAYSHALGVACSTDYPAPGFEKIKKMYLQPVPKGVPLGWDRGAMLRYGDFPSSFLTQSTRANVLDQVAKDKDQDFSGGGENARILGLPDDTVALNLEALGDDQRAVFDAVAQMGDEKNPNLQEHLKLLLEYSKLNSDAQSALGHAIDVGSGVHGHEDANGNWHVDAGKHDAWESTFAFDAILAAGHAETHEFNGLFKKDMGRLAASYAPEMLIGGHNVDENSGDSSFGSPTEYDDVLGVDPAFYLSPQDTYRFMKTFSDDDGMTAPFDEAMGKLQHDVLIRTAKFDHDAIAAGKQDPRTYDLAAKAFGNTQRLEYDAEMKIRGEMDESEKAFKEHLKQAAILGSELTGEPELSAVWTLAWRGGMFAAKEYGGGAYVESGPERTEKVDEKNFEMVAQARYTMATTLMEGGWKTTPLPDDLKGEDGKLKSFEELSKDHQLEAFNDWANEQREGDVPFHTKQVLSAGELSNQDADVYVKEVDGE
ncbi:hypothetical protein [Streptomyces sp. HUAS TT20]|uniref:hypothetical protein n=1 Tax=Streptomyces sp. HUAS TT20 TaxID=3447509 RepID=UPI0021D97C3F|nr:hypothetical protein [Streptomyces sp. HUAS 15-9]UXY29164.1 hypothetical protein N8I87_23155 [Streptomyces sp. HUAS 15-9]